MPPSNNISSILQKPNASIENVMEDDDSIQEIKNGNPEILQL